MSTTLGVKVKGNPCTTLSGASIYKIPSQNYSTFKNVEWIFFVFSGTWGGVEGLFYVFTCGLDVGRYVVDVGDV